MKQQDLFAKGPEEDRAPGEPPKIKAPCEQFNLSDGRHGDLPDEAKPRLNRQCNAILDRLRLGSATNRELSLIALSYTRRITDIKRAGYHIEIIEKDDVTGFNLYALKSS